MAIKITDECINCGACEPECPNNAIYEASEDWNYSEGTNLKWDTDTVLLIGENINLEEFQEPLSDDTFYIVPNKCTECIGFYNEPQCAAVCPVDCCVLDEENEESEEELLSKQRLLHKK